MYKNADFLPTETPWLEWSWRVDEMQIDADIRDELTDDFAAAIMVVFSGGLLSRSQVLIYGWTNDQVPAGSIVHSPRYPDRVRTIVLRNDPAELGNWVMERRNLVADYQRVFDTKLPSTVELIGLCSDNDQTRQPVEAYYGPMTASSH